MASGDNRAETVALDGTDLTVGIISARWNAEVVDRLVEGAQRGLAAAGVTNVDHKTVPGAFELPLAALLMAQTKTFDALVVLGAVIRGETTHYELVAGECGRGIMDVQLETKVPIGMGVLTVENLAQAHDRSEGPGGHNVGEEAVLVALELAHLSTSISIQNRSN